MTDTSRWLVRGRKADRPALPGHMRGVRWCIPSYVGAPRRTRLPTFGIRDSAFDLREGPPEGTSLVVGTVKAFVEAHAGEAMDLDRLAREANLSKYHFARTFREAEGVTPWAYVQRVRVRRARALLDAGLPLAEVALRAGFYDQSHLTNTFKRLEGMTPGAYRRKRKDLQERRRGER